MVATTLGEDFDSGTLGGPIVSGGIVVTDDIVPPIYDDSHTRSAPLSASGDSAISFRYLGETPWTTILSSSAWTYLTGPTDAWAMVPLVSFILANGDVAAGFFLDSDTLYWNETVGGTPSPPASTGVSLPLDAWVEWVFNGTAVSIRLGGTTTLWESPPVDTPEWMSTVLHYLPDGQMWLDDFSAVFDVISTATCLQNAERSSCVMVKQPDGTWSDLKLVGV